MIYDAIQVVRWWWLLDAPAQRTNAPATTMLRQSHSPVNIKISTMLRIVSTFWPKENLPTHKYCEIIKFAWWQPCKIGELNIQRSFDLWNWNWCSFCPLVGANCRYVSICQKTGGVTISEGSAGITWKRSKLWQVRLEWGLEEGLAEEIHKS